jgi:hypothetical protein
MTVCAVAAQQNPVSLAGLPDFCSMQQRAARIHVAVASLASGILVGMLCLAVSIVSAVVGHDFAIAGPDSLLLRLGVAFSGAGLIGALPFVPFVLWLSGRQVRLKLAGLWIVGAALTGAILGEWSAPLVKMNPYEVRFPGVLFGAGTGAIAGACFFASVSGVGRRSR